MRYLFYTISLLFVATTSLCQGGFQKEEYDIIKKLPDDTGKVRRLTNYARKILYVSPAEAGSILNDAMTMARKLNDDYGLAQSYGLRATLYFYNMKLDSSSRLLDSAFELIGQKRDRASKELMASLLVNMGALKQQQQETDSAVQYYLQAANSYEKINLPEKAIPAFYNISGIYRYLNDTAQALFYARQTRSMAVSSGDSMYLLRSLIVLGDAFALTGDYDSVLWSVREGLDMERKLKMPFAFGKFHDLLGQYHANKTKEYDSAVYHYKIAHDTIASFNIPFDEALVLQHFGEAFLKKGDYLLSIQYSKRASELARKLDMNNILFYTLKNLSKAYEATGDFSEGYKYLKEFLIVSDTLQNRNNRKLVLELEAEYQAQKKEAQLEMQARTIQEKTFTNYFLASGLVALGSISVLLFVLIRNKQKLQRQRINELEIEKQLAATEAVLKGEEQERTRLAKDLHDGLGGMLSGIKYSFQNMKENLIMAPENQIAFGRSMDMLDSSIKEMRRVAHNMMPEALVKFGLDIALRDFCNDINQSGVIQVVYQSSGMGRIEIDYTTAITLYRVVQELVNNIIRHSGATTAIVQISRNEGVIMLTVEDNGRGFDASDLKQTKGIGWSNIQSRIDFLKGKVDVQSLPGKGTSILIELKV